MKIINLIINFLKTRLKGLEVISKVCSLSLQEEEGDDADVSTAPSLASHRLPPAVHVQHYTARYSDTAYSGLGLRDAHEENPESILDEHVQRVMKTPGCQSPKSRSPDGLPATKIPGHIAPLPSGQGKHQTRLGPKGELGHVYHHKHTHHTHHAEGEGMRQWNVEQHHYGSKTRNYSDGTSSVEPIGYR